MCLVEPLFWFFFLFLLFFLSLSIILSLSNALLYSFYPCPLALTLFLFHFSFHPKFFFSFIQQYWDPSLAMVMMGAIAVAAPGFSRLRTWKLQGRGPLLPSETNRVPDSSWKVDAPLLVGVSGQKGQGGT